MAKFVSLVDARHNGEMPREDAFKLWRFHIYKHGEGSCYVEEDGVELDPTED